LRKSYIDIFWASRWTDWRDSRSRSASGGIAEFTSPQTNHSWFVADRSKIPWFL